MPHPAAPATATREVLHHPELGIHLLHDLRFRSRRAKVHKWENLTRKPHKNHKISYPLLTNVLVYAIHYIRAYC